MRACPSDQALRMLGGDELGSVMFEAIAAHVEACLECRSRLESFAWECATTTIAGPCPLPRAGELPLIRGFAIERELAPTRSCT